MLLRSAPPLGYYNIVLNVSMEKGILSKFYALQKIAVVFHLNFPWLETTAILKLAQILDIFYHNVET